MKKKIMLAPLLVCAILFADAQDTTTHKTTTGKGTTQNTKNSTTTNKNKNTATTNKGTTTTNSGTTNKTTTTTGTNSGMNQNNTSTNRNNTGTTGSGTTNATGTTGAGNTGTTGSGTTGTGTTGTGNTGTGTTGTGNTGTTGTTGTTTNTTATGTTGHMGTDHSGMTGGVDTGGQMTSTGRYAAMGVRTGSLHKKDMKFVMLANSSNMLELQLSQLALQNASSQAVKDFAAMMVQHHSMAGQEMKTMLASKGAMIPDTAMMSRHRMQMDMLTNLQGAEFDRAYMRIMVDAHEEDVDEYEDETTDARDADIRAFATRMMPTLRMHYTRAKELRKQVR